MNKRDETFLYDVVSDNLALMSKIYQSFEALEETLGKLKLERPLFLTYMAKMAFAEEVFKRAGEDVNFCKPTPTQVKKCRNNECRSFN